MTDVQNKYNSRAAQLYKDKLSKMAQQACKEYGTTLLINEIHYHHEEPSKEKDFFAECENNSIENQSDDKWPLKVKIQTFVSIKSF